MKRTKIQILFVLAVATFLSSCQGNSEQNMNKGETVRNNSSFNASKLDSLFDILDQQNKFMGTISLSNQGNVIYSRSVGYDDVESNKPSTSNSIYRIASISKMYTATLVFKAIEENKVNLHQTIEEFFPTIENADKITVGNLLNHRSGIHSFTKDKAFFEYRTEPKTRKEMMEIIANYPIDFEPNSRSEYSNSNYYLLSIILEEIYDSSYENILSEKIISPLKLNQTYYGGKIKLDDNEANSYIFSDTWVKQEPTDLSIPMGAGALVSSASDLNKFIEALFNEKLITKESLDFMTNIEDNFGMGIMNFSLKDHVGYGHGGNIEGFNAKSLYFPKEELAVGIVSNGIDYDINRFTVEVLKCYFNEPFELPNFEQAEITASELGKYVGIYVGESLPGKFIISQEGNILYAQLNDLPKETLVYKGKDKFTNQEIGANFLFNLEKNQLGLEQNGVPDIYMYTKE